MDYKEEYDNMNIADLIASLEYQAMQCGNNVDLYTKEMAEETLYVRHVLFTKLNIKKPIVLYDELAELSKTLTYLTWKVEENKVIAGNKENELHEFHKERASFEYMYGYEIFADAEAAQFMKDLHDMEERANKTIQEALGGN